MRNPEFLGKIWHSQKVSKWNIDLSIVLVVENCKNLLVSIIVIIKSRFYAYELIKVQIRSIHAEGSWGVLRGVLRGHPEARYGGLFGGLFWGQLWGSYRNDSGLILGLILGGFWADSGAF